MKKFFSLLLIFAFLLSSFSTLVFAVKGYENQGFSLEIPEELKQDKTFAFENGYVDYWHSDKYEIEVALWNSENPIAVGPVAGEKICYDIPNGQIKFSKNENKDVEINLLKGTYISGTLKYEDVSVDYHRYLFENDGKHYNISFFLRDSDYKHYIDEIIIEVPMISANVDTLILVDPSEGNTENVVNALKAYKDYLAGASREYDAVIYNEDGTITINV